jgi:ABC-type transport system involved in cytochrome bd biosynthesis fused ATPase/permease subunit
MGRQLLLLSAAFLVGVIAALALGAINLGTALGVGQVCFAAMLVYVLLSSRSDRAPED